ncbi:hypothetical protein [Streptomyces lichenis]|uniref:DUF262 domain-containing protein n=1 Tax=Streptomyces lichenis TaxID=2306967 RepID=A0ABT0I555_9ACTN|nr:hypothetical protein [Streptomyces lichenis]MCK8676440.1 hypothetical protein [Streptomyces lichenis]
MDVAAADIASLGAGSDRAAALGACRGPLLGTELADAWEQLLRDRPEDFGAVGIITLGADAVRLLPASGAFADRVLIEGVECIDGMQRLVALATARAEHGPRALNDVVVRLEVICGAERDRVRRLHDEADQYVSHRTSQDRLIRCPSIRSLMQANWETWRFDPRRGMVREPDGADVPMADVTRALACLTGPGPELVHTVSSDEGLHTLWEDISSPSYRSLFHSSMTPVGVARAVEAWATAQATLKALPKARSQGHGHLIVYAPDLICWTACNFLRRFRLHASASRLPWAEIIAREVPHRTRAAAETLVRRFESVRPGRHLYQSSLRERSLWTALVEPDVRA